MEVIYLIENFRNSGGQMKGNEICGNEISETWLFLRKLSLFLETFGTSFESGQSTGKCSP